MKNYRIEQMTAQEVSCAVDWAAREGWNPGLYDADCFYQADPHGFFAGKLNGTIIAVGSAVLYDEHFAFCGLYIVDKKYRDKGYGLLLTEARLAYINPRNAGIDGVMDMLDKYERIGYRFAHNNARYCLTEHYARLQPDAHVHSAKAIDFLQLSAYDRLHFPAPRPQFLSCWINQPQSNALAYVKEGKIQGYGVIRTCRQGYKIGPLFADTPDIARALFHHLSDFSKGKEVYLDIPENNPDAVALVQELKMKKVFATARMYLKGEPVVKKEHIYGITTFELG